MIKKSTLEFLNEIQVNNNKAWFDSHKDIYNTARQAFIESVEEMITALKSFEPDLGHLTAKECIFRINRDVRFSKDKRPYKNNMSAYFNRGGKKGEGAGYYMHIEPGHSFAAAGVWMPETPNLSKIRQEIDYNFNEWKKIVGSTAFKNKFVNGIDSSDSLVRPPKGYEETNPAIGFLKLKSFVIRRPFTDQALQEKSFTGELAKTFKAAKPMLDFINRSLD